MHSASIVWNRKTQRSLVRGRGTSVVDQIRYSKTCVKWPLAKRPKIRFQDQLSLYAGQKYSTTLLTVWQNAPSGAFCNTFNILYGTICHSDLCYVCFWVAVLLRFYCISINKVYDIWAEMWNIWLCCMQTTKEQTSLCICTVWSAPLLFTSYNDILACFIYSRTSLARTHRDRRCEFEPSMYSSDT